jgi:hypothetical protein
VLLAALSRAGDTLGVDEVGRGLLRVLEADARDGERGARVRLLLALELGAPAMVAEFDQLLTTHHIIANDLDAAATYAETALGEARRYGLVELTVVVMALTATIAAIRGQRQDAERGAAEAVEAAEGLSTMIRAGVSGTPLTAAALADDDPAVAVRRVSETRALLPDDIVFLRPFIGSFYGIAAVVKAVAGDGVLAEGRDWVEMDDVFQRCSYLIARAIVAGRAAIATGRPLCSPRATTAWFRFHGFVRSTVVTPARRRSRTAGASPRDGWWKRRRIWSAAETSRSRGRAGRAFASRAHPPGAGAGRSPRSATPASSSRRAGRTCSRCSPRV